MTHVSPEQAKELLAGDFDTETRQEWAGGLQADFDNFSGAYINGTPGDFALADASVELAQTVADMKWEYAVQGLDDYGVWRFTDYTGSLILPPHRAEIIAWYCAPIARDQIERLGPGWRVVRRLASAPEVVE